MSPQDRIKALSDARLLMDPIRVGFAATKNPAWIFLWHADNYLAKQQEEIFREIFKPPSRWKLWTERMFS